MVAGRPTVADYNQAAGERCKTVSGLGALADN